MADEFDVIVIGGGPAGTVAGGRLAAGGLSVVVVESERVGGECAYWACIPSKALLRPVEQLDIGRHTPGVERATRGPMGVADILKFRDQMTHHYDDASQVSWLNHAKIALVRGRGRLDGARQVLVKDATGPERRLTARKAVVIATGSRTAFPPVPGLMDARPWTNREATGARSAPRRLIVLGGGPVGVELSHAWKALGSSAVTLISHGKLLSRNEPFVGELITRALRNLGIDLRLPMQVKQVRRQGAEVTVTLADGDTIVGDEILIATGRVPATQELGLETVGLKSGAAIEVDDSLRAKNVAGGWLYACGDSNGRNMLTHMGKYQARLAADAILGKTVSAWAATRATPQVIFTEPQVASVGLTQAAAEKQGLRVRAVRVPLEDVAGTSLLGLYWKGVAQMVVDEDRRVLVGATFVGPGVGEMIHAATIAIVGEVTLDKLWNAVAAFPTVSEVWLSLLEAYGL